MPVQFRDMEKKHTDGELLHLWSNVRKGNRESLARLFCVSYSWLFNYGYSIYPDEVSVEDAIQELFLILWKSRNGIKQAESVKSYLLISLRRIILRRLKREKNRVKRHESYMEYLVPEANNIEEVIIKVENNQDKKEDLKKALDMLSKRQREVVNLKFYRGLSSSEIAKIMDINKQSVYNHVSEALEKMKKVA